MTNKKKQKKKKKTGNNSSNNNSSFFKSLYRNIVDIWNNEKETDDSSDEVCDDNEDSISVNGSKMASDTCASYIATLLHRIAEAKAKAFGIGI